MRNHNRFRGDRHDRALGIAIRAAIIVFLTVCVGGATVVLLGFGAPRDENPTQRGFLLAMGSAQFALWSGLIGYGLSRLVIRIRSGPVPPEPAHLPTPTPDFSTLSDGSQFVENLSNTENDRGDFETTEETDEIDDAGA